MSDKSKFKDEEIEQHLRETVRKRKNVDYERAELMRNLKILAEQGREEDFEVKLLRVGIQRGSEQWRKAKLAFQAFRQLR
jgi:hypothetical protein